MSSTVVIFDVDGTLVDSTYLHALAWERAFVSRGHDVATWRVHRAIGMGGDKLVAAVLGDEVEAREGDELRAAWQREFKPLADEVRPLPGAADLVRQTHERGFLVALASSGKSKDVEQAAAMLGIDDVLDAITSVDDADASKPDPDLLQATLDKTGADRAVMVGDTVWDVEAANRIGLPTVCFRTGGFGPDELAGAGAVEVLDEPVDALGLDWAAIARAPRAERE